MNLVTWAVVMTTNDPAPLVAAMVWHHLDQGAAEVWVYLDGADEGIGAMLADEPRCHVTVCDAAYWGACGEAVRPPLHVVRQILNARDAYRRCRARWLLHCDTDEFVSCGAALAQDLRGLAWRPWVNFVRLRVAERVWPKGGAQEDVFSGVFRMPFPDGRSPSPFLNAGLSGHTVGKALVRTRGGWRMGVHGPELPERRWMRFGFMWREAREARLLHFDAITEVHWVVKMLRKRAAVRHKGEAEYAPSRTRLIRRVEAAVTKGRSLRDILDQVLCLTPRAEAELRDAGLLFAPVVDAGAAYRARYGALTVTQVDAALIAGNPDLAEDVAAVMAVTPLMDRGVP